jgi:hypothetical protein
VTSSLWLSRLRTAYALGPRNIARVASYRLRLRTGLHSVQRLAAAPPRGPFFLRPAAHSTLRAPAVWRGESLAFGWHRHAYGDAPPDWRRHPFTGRQVGPSDAPWWTIPDFGASAGDIKAVWELSRFDWVLAFAQQAAAGESAGFERLNEWLADWCEQNRPYTGPNWKCGQEASIRVLHLATAALILDQVTDPAAGMPVLIRRHLERIAPTMGYAVGQDNNHGTSEAAALFVGGSWLERLGERGGARWARAGRRWLEDRVARLVQPDGSFSQYSPNYHRLMLDTLSVAETWRRQLGATPFSLTFRERAAAASRWLRAFVDPVAGDVPNIGANDGANLLPLTDADYRDYRPAAALATALFEERSAWQDDQFPRTHLLWLRVAPPPAPAPVPGTSLFDHGGYAVLIEADVRAVLRYPRFRFRPAHADALHVDLWAAGENLLRDSGSFSYQAPAECGAYFSGVRGHNTIQFDQREQMPRLGRFLWGDWLTTDVLRGPERVDGRTVVTAGYTDGYGARHIRTLQLSPGRVVVTDRVAGFDREAIVRWRLRPATWVLEGQTATDGRHRITLATDAVVRRCEMVTGWESRYYLARTEIPVLEFAISSPGTVQMEYRWTP